MNKIITTIYFSILIAIVFILLSPWFWFADLASTYIPMMIIFVVIVAVFELKIKKYDRAIIVIVMYVLIAWPWIRLYFPAHESGAKHISHTSETVQILFANVNKINTNYDSLIDIIRRESADIVLLSEITTEWDEALSQSLSEHYPYDYTMASADYMGMAIYSQIEMAAHLAFDLADNTPPVQFVTFAEPKFSIFNIHLLSPINEDWAYERNLALMRFASLMNIFDRPTVAAGDFNLSNTSRILQRFLETTKLRNGRQGFGWKPTWYRGTVLAADIDHVFHSEHFSMTSFRVLEGFGSDHRPIIVDLIIK